MTSKSKERKVSIESRFICGIVHSFVWGLVGLVVVSTGAQGNAKVTLSGTGLAGIIGFAYGMARATEETEKERNDKRQRIREQIERRDRERNERIRERNERIHKQNERIREQNEFNAYLNKPRRLIPVERLSREQIENYNLLIRSLEVWDDVLETLSGVPRIAAGTHILELQKIKREVAYLDWSESFILVRDTLIAYMDSVIKKFHDFQADRIGWRWNTGEIEKLRKYIYLALEQVGVMEPY